MGEIFTNYIFDERTVSRIYIYIKTLFQLNNKAQIIQFKSGPRI